MDIFRVAFFGHRRIYDLIGIEEKLVLTLEKLLYEKEFVELYIGRNGDFDEFVASVVKRIQKRIDMKNSSLILVLPYTLKDMEYYAKYYDEIIIPESIGKAYPKAAITLRNKWMVDVSDLLISYIEREDGGAYTAVKYAEKLGKSVINISKKG